MKRIVLPALSLFITASLGALDYGMLLTQQLEATDARVSTPSLSDDVNSYTVGVEPRFSMIFGDSADLYISARMTINTSREPLFIPELMRSEYSLRHNKLMISLGRMPYTAPFEYVVNGLFDGVKASFYYPFGTLYCGLWYTGLLYKNEANIVITDDDKHAYLEPVDYGRFDETYFASRRLVGALGWEHPSVAGIFSAKTAFIFQIDLNGADENSGAPLNSQYIMARFSLPYRNLSFQLGGILQTAETEGETSAGFTCDMGLSCYLPVGVTSLLSLTGHFSLDNGKSAVPNLIPINSKSFGRITDISPSGISAFTLDYSVRISAVFSAMAGILGYIQNDLPEQSGRKGCEIYAQMTWAPLSDIMVNLGGGYDISSDPKWKINVLMTLSIL